jgi:hypothetical protein
VAGDRQSGGAAQFSPRDTTPRRHFGEKRCLRVNELAALTLAAGTSSIAIVTGREIWPASS